MHFKTHGRIIRGASTAIGSPHPKPSLPQRAMNFGRAILAEGVHKLLRRPARTEEEKQRFLETCRNCPGKFYDAPTDTCHHPKCGCPMRRKSRWNSTFCPGDYVKFESSPDGPQA